MKEFFKSKLYKLIVVGLLIYAVCIIYNQQTKLDSYAAEKQYYQDQISNLNEQKEELIAEKENVNSPEYIEDIAREKLDMYYPNEKVYMDRGMTNHASFFVQSPNII